MRLSIGTQPKIPFLPKRKVIEINSDDDDVIILPPKKVVKVIEIPDLDSLNGFVNANQKYSLESISSELDDNTVQELIAHCANFSMTFSDINTLKGRFKRHLEVQELALTLLEKNVKLYKYIDKSLRFDAAIVKKVISKDPSLFTLMIQPTRRKKKFPFSNNFLQTLIEEANPEVFRYFPEKMKENVCLILCAIESDVTLFKEIPLAKQKDSIFIDDLFLRMYPKTRKEIEQLGYLGEELQFIIDRYC